MPYRPSLSKTPTAVLALWDGQDVLVRGFEMQFRCKSDSNKVFLSTGNDGGAAFTKAWDAYMSGAVGFTNSPPRYDHYYQHVREGSSSEVQSKAEFSREELVQLLTSGNYHIS